VINFSQKALFPWASSMSRLVKLERGVEMLSRDCDGCKLQLFECKRRFAKVEMGEKVYCPDGTAHLVD
jgi:uncharacterized Zn finger protein (UPF0148 family)